MHFPNLKTANTGGARVAARPLARWALAIVALIMTVALFAPSMLLAQDKAPAKPTVSLYGFLRIDGVWDDSKMQNHQYAMWVLPEDPAVGISDNNYLTIYPRVTRFGLNVASFELGEKVTASGKIEIDFQSGGTESRAGLRMRHAYFELKYGDFALLGGQTWQLLSPLYPEVHTDGVLWNAGNLGDRAPQLRLTYAPKVGKGSVVAAAALGATGAVDAQDLDKNTYLDGASSAVPNVQGHLMLEQTLYANRPLKFGVWGHYAQEQTDKPFVGETRWDSWSGGLELSLPLVERVWIEGEYWMGSNLSDVRGGAGQGINLFTGKEIDARGGWIELATKPTDKTQLYLGWSADDPEDEDLVSYDEVLAANEGLAADKKLDPVTYTGRTLNWVGFVSARYRVWQPFQVAVEYYHWVTEYKGLESGIDNRIDMHFSYFF